MNSLRCHAFCLFCVLLTPAARGASPWPRVNINELSGGPLDRPASVAWSQAPLRRALQNLSQLHEIGVVLDRRVDPGQEVTLSGGDPLGALISSAADHLQLGASNLGDVVYLGPRESALKLRTLAAIGREQTKKLPPRELRKAVEPAAWRWPVLSTPRELAVATAAESGLSIANPEAIPHDLWPAGDLPKLGLTERLTLLLVQFDLTFEASPQSTTLRLVRTPDVVSVERSFAVEGSRARAITERLRASAPHADISNDGRQLRVSGRYEEVELASRLVRGDDSRKAQPPLSGQMRHKLTVKNVPLRQLLSALEKSLKLKMKIDHAALEQAGISPDVKVSVTVANATTDELLEAIFQPVGLAYEQRGEVIEIRPADTPQGAAEANVTPTRD